MSAGAVSRHELKIEHRRVHERYKAVKESHDLMRSIVLLLRESYIDSKAVFPFCRYSLLVAMIEEATSETNLDLLKARVRDAWGQGVVQHQSSTQDESRPLLSGKKPYGKIRQALRKFEKVIGFDDDPIEDEDVMDDTGLNRSIARKTRMTSSLLNDLELATDLLTTLRYNFQESRNLCPVFRYFRLKALVRAVIQAADV